MYEHLIILLVCASLLIQLIFFVINSIVLFYRQCYETENYEPVSVIISARNEFDNIQNFLHRILEQDYSEFELIVVNDRSDDGTADILSELKNNHKQLKVLEINKKEVCISGKKQALDYAISKAQYEILLFIDADCYPVSDKWIKSMVANYNNRTDILLGYGGYIIKRGFLNKLIRTETALIAQQYFSFALLGLPFMGVGRNISYRRRIYKSIGGFKKHLNVLSGDDDLFIRDAAKKENTKIVLCKDSFTKSVPKKSFKDWIKQKRRHLEAGSHYNFIIKLLLFIEPFSKLVFYSAIILGLIFSVKPLLLIFLYVIRLFILFLVFGVFSKRMNEKGILIFIPIFDFLLPALNLFIYLSSFFVNNREWN